MSRFIKEKNMGPNRTAERFGISRHPHFEDKYIMTENATNGILKTGTKDELSDFCAEKLAASVNLSAAAQRVCGVSRKADNYGFPPSA